MRATFTKTSLGVAAVIALGISYAPAHGATFTNNAEGWAVVTQEAREALEALKEAK